MLRVPFRAAELPRELVEQGRVNWIVERLGRLRHLVLRELVRENTSHVGVEHSGHHVDWLPVRHQVVVLFVCGC